MVEHLVDTTIFKKEGRWPQHLNWAINRVFSNSSPDFNIELNAIIKGCSYLYDKKEQEKIARVYLWKLPEYYWTERDVARIIFMAQAESWQSFYGEDSYTRLIATYYFNVKEVPPQGDSDEIAWKILDKYANNLKTAYSDYSPWVYCVKAVIRFMQGELTKVEDGGNANARDS